MTKFRRLNTTAEDTKTVEAGIVGDMIESFKFRNMGGLDRPGVAQELENRATATRPLSPAAPTRFMDDFFQNNQARNTQNALLDPLGKNLNSNYAAKQLENLIQIRVGKFDIHKALNWMSSTPDVAHTLNEEAPGIMLIPKQNGVPTGAAPTPVTVTWKDLLMDGSKNSYRIDPSQLQAYNDAREIIVNNIVKRHNFDTNANNFIKWLEFGTGAAVVGPGIIAIGAAMYANSTMDKPSDEDQQKALTTDPQWSPDANPTTTPNSSVPVAPDNSNAMPGYNAPVITPSNSTYKFDDSGNIVTNHAANATKRFAEFGSMGNLGPSVNPGGQTDAGGQSPDEVLKQLPQLPPFDEVYSKFMALLGKNGEGLDQADKYLSNMTSYAHAFIDKYSKLVPEDTGLNSIKAAKNILERLVLAQSGSTGGAAPFISAIQSGASAIQNATTSAGGDSVDPNKNPANSDQIDPRTFANQDTDVSSMELGQGGSRQNLNSQEALLMDPHDGGAMAQKDVAPYMMTILEIANNSGQPNAMNLLMGSFDHPGVAVFVARRCNGDLARATSMLSVFGQYAQECPEIPVLQIAREACEGQDYAGKLNILRMAITGHREALEGGDGNPLKTADLQQTFDWLRNPNSQYAALVSKTLISNQKLRQQVESMSIMFSKISALWQVKRNEYCAKFYSGIVKAMPSIVKNPIFNTIMGWVNSYAAATSIMGTLKSTVGMGPISNLNPNTSPSGGGSSTGFVQSSEKRKKFIYAEDNNQTMAPAPAAPTAPNGTAAPSGSPDQMRANLADMANNGGANPTQYKNTVSDDSAYQQLMGKYWIGYNEAKIAVSTYETQMAMFTSQVNGGSGIVFNGGAGGDHPIPNGAAYLSPEAIVQLGTQMNTTVTSALASISKALGSFDVTYQNLSNYAKDDPNMNVPGLAQDMVKAKTSLQQMYTNMKMAMVNITDFSIIGPIETEIRVLMPKLERIQYYITKMSGIQGAAKSNNTVGIQPQIVYLTMSPDGYRKIITLCDKGIAAYQNAWKRNSGNKSFQQMCHNRAEQLRTTQYETKVDMSVLKAQLIGDAANPSANDPAMMDAVNRGLTAKVNIFHKDKFVRFANEPNELEEREADQEGEDYWAGFYDPGYAKEMFEGDGAHMLSDEGQMRKQRHRKKIHLNP